MLDTVGRACLVSERADQPPMYHHGPGSYCLEPFGRSLFDV
jgi:hypothetical protein